MTSIQKALLSALVMLGGVLSIERAYSGAGLIDALVVLGIVVTLGSGLALLWPRGETDDGSPDEG